MGSDKPDDEYVDYDDDLVINNNFKIRFIEAKRKVLSSSRDYQVKYDKYLDFLYNKEVGFDELNKDCSNFLKLLKFTSCDNSIGYKITSAYIKKKHLIKGTDYKGRLKMVTEGDCEVSSIYSQDDFIFEKIKPDFWHQNKMLFSAWCFDKKELSIIIQKWFNNFQMIPIYDLFIDSYNWFDGKVLLSNVMFNNKFLNLIQGLEAYYNYLDPKYEYKNETFVKERQTIINSLENPEYRNWIRNNTKFNKKATLADKLTFLCNRYSGILSNVPVEISPFVKNYPYEAKEFRNKLSHGKIHQTFQGFQLNKLYKFSQFLLCICILESLELKEDKINSRLEVNLFLNNALKTIMLK